MCASAGPDKLAGEHPCRVGFQKAEKSNELRNCVGMLQSIKSSCLFFPRSVRFSPLANSRVVNSIRTMGSTYPRKGNPFRPAARVASQRQDVWYVLSGHLIRFFHC